MLLHGILLRYFRGARWLILALLAGAAIGLADVAAAQDGPKVLVLYSSRADTELPLAGERDLPRIFQTGLANVDYYSEFMDVMVSGAGGEATYRDS